VETSAKSYQSSKTSSSVPNTFYPGGGTFLAMKIQQMRHEKKMAKAAEYERKLALEREKPKLDDQTLKLAYLSRFKKNPKDRASSPALTIGSVGSSGSGQSDIPMEYYKAA